MVCGHNCMVVIFFSVIYQLRSADVPVMQMKMLQRHEKMRLSLE